MNEQTNDTEKARRESLQKVADLYGFPTNASGGLSLKGDVVDAHNLGFKAGLTAAKEQQAWVAVDEASPPAKDG